MQVPNLPVDQGLHNVPLWAVWKNQKRNRRIHYQYSTNQWDQDIGKYHITSRLHFTILLLITEAPHASQIKGALRSMEQWVFSLPFSAWTQCSSSRRNMYRKEKETDVRNRKMRRKPIKISAFVDIVRTAVILFSNITQGCSRYFLHPHHPTIFKLHTNIQFWHLLHLWDTAVNSF